MAALPLSLRAYRCATTAFAPIVPLALRSRALRGKEAPERLQERFGIASRPRPEGELLWFHGASVGECQSVLGLIEALLNNPSRSVLLTSGTVASAELMARRLSDGVIHQFAPVDTPVAVARFLDHWRPDAAFFVDSEIWPNMLLDAHRRGIRLGIVNGRMSEKSFAGWRKARHMAESLLSLYDICLVQDAAAAARFEGLGAKSVQITGSLKADAPPLPANDMELAALADALQGRPLFLAASTHEGEIEAVLAAHDLIRADFPSLLTVIVPRHPARAARILAAAKPRKVALRSKTEPVDDTTELYVADTMGELGLFYRLAPLAFIGGSLVAHGGQNPLEAAKLGAAVLSGPHTHNFEAAYHAIFTAQGCGRIRSGPEMAALIVRLMREESEMARLRHAAALAVTSLEGALKRTRSAVETMLARHASP